MSAQSTSFLMNPSVLVTHEECLQHVTPPGHPEQVARLEYILEALKDINWKEKGKTISELLYIPNSVLDGFGFLQIQIPNWGLDAAPSRPIFYPV